MEYKKYNGELRWKNIFRENKENICENKITRGGEILANKTSGSEILIKSSIWLWVTTYWDLSFISKFTLI